MFKKSKYKVEIQPNRSKFQKGPYLFYVWNTKHEIVASGYDFKTAEAAAIAGENAKLDLEIAYKITGTEARKRD